MKNFCALALTLLLLQSCKTIKQSSKYGFNEGFYKSRLYHKKLKSLYVIPEVDSIKVYTTKSLGKAAVDTSQSLKISFPFSQKPDSFNNYIFRQNTLDIDVLSILCKYRPSVKDFPPQFNTSILNGAFYVGYRTDYYHINYKKSPLNIFSRDVIHYGLSFGLFSGIGATRIDPFVTQNALDIEYDGFVNTSGIAAIFAIDKLSFGLNTGFDHLLDKNRKYWVNNGKLWIGLSIGLNIN